MRKLTFVTLLALLFAFALAAPGSAQSVSVVPSLGVGANMSGNMEVTNPGLSATAGLLFKFGDNVLSQQSFELGTADNTVAGHDAYAGIYDGNVMLRTKKDGLAFGVGLRTTFSEWSTSFENTVTHPYFAIAQETKDGISKLEFILPGNDGWREQFGLLLSDDIGVIQVNQHHLAVTLTAGLFTYYASPGDPVLVFQSQGVSKYEVVKPGRSYGGTVGIGVKYYFR